MLSEIFFNPPERLINKLQQKAGIVVMLGPLDNLKLMIGIVGIWAPRSLGNGYEAIEAAMNGEVLLGALAVLLIIKIVATSITLGSGNSGGIFAPSLFMGVMLGVIASCLMFAVSYSRIGVIRQLESYRTARDSLLRKYPGQPVIDDRVIRWS